MLTGIRTSKQAENCPVALHFFVIDDLRESQQQKEVIAIAAERVPVWEKVNLTLEEASALYNVGVNKLREITNNDDCPFVLFVGNKRLIKRRPFDRYLEACYSI